MCDANGRRQGLSLGPTRTRNARYSSGRSPNWRRFNGKPWWIVSSQFSCEAGVRWRGPWRSLEAVEFATLEWVDWFNNRRLLEPIGNIPPAEAEERYYAMLEQPAMAA